MNQKKITIAAVLATSLLVAVFATTTTLLFAYAQDSSETNFEQNPKQKGIASGFGNEINNCQVLGGALSPITASPSCTTTP